MSILTSEQPQAGKGSLYSWTKNKCHTNPGSLTWKCAKCSHLAVIFDHRFKAYHSCFTSKQPVAQRNKIRFYRGQFTQESYVWTSQTAFTVFGSTATPADYTSMEEIGTVFYSGRSPLQSTTQLLIKIEPGALWEFRRSKEASETYTEWINIPVGKIHRDIAT